MAYAQERLSMFSTMFSNFFLSALIVLLCLATPYNASADENVQLKGYDADAAVTCVDNFTYVAGEGCTLSEGRVNNFRLDGNSSVFGFGQCLPQMVGGERQWSTDNISIHDIGNGNVIVRQTEPDGSIKFKKVTKDIIDNPNASLPGSETYIHDANASAGEKGGEFTAFNNYAIENLNESLEIIYNSGPVPLNAEKWFIGLSMSSQITGSYYIVGMIFGPDGEVEPSANALPGTTGLFPISYAGPLQELGAEQPPAPPDFMLVLRAAPLLDPSTGEPSGKFVVVWVRPKEAGGSHDLIYGKVFDENGTAIGSGFGESFGETLLQDPNLPAAAVSAYAPGLTSLSNGGFALEYADVAADKRQVQLFDQNGDPVDGGTILGGEEYRSGTTRNVVRELEDDIIALFTRDNSSGDSYAEIWDISTPSAPTQLVASTLLYADLTAYNPMPIESDKNKVMVVVREPGQTRNMVYFASFNGSDTISKTPQWFRLTPTSSSFTGATIIYDTETIGDVDYTKFFHMYRDADDDYVSYNYRLADCW